MNDTPESLDTHSSHSHQNQSEEKTQTDQEQIMKLQRRNLESLPKANQKSQTMGRPYLNDGKDHLQVMGSKRQSKSKAHGLISSSKVQHT